MSETTIYDEFLSSTIRRMKKSVIRELLKLVAKPEIISFAGGLPAPDTFPVKEIEEITRKILQEDGKRLLQYGPTEGDEELKKLLIERFMKQTGMKNLNNDNILIVSASQQALDIVSKVFLDPGDNILVERPSYIGGLSAFNSYKANMIGVSLEDDGLNIEELEETLKDIYEKRGQTIKFMYVIPDFQNPAGVTTSKEKREKILELAEKYDFLIIEDSPYRELRYSGEEQPSMFAMDGGKRVVALFTFSKIFCPGLRLGWIIAPKELIQKFIVAKQAMDLCTPPFNQAIAREYVKSGKIDKRIKENIALYTKKRDAMLAAMEKYFPKIENLHWTKPEGGLFLWVTLPEYMDSDKMFFKAVENNVAYVVGSAFYGESPAKNCFRMNFSYPSFEEIEEGVKRLAKVIENEIK